MTQFRPAACALSTALMFAIAPISASGDLTETSFGVGTPTAAAQTKDPRAGDPAFERSRKLFGQIRKILDEAAKVRLKQATKPDGAVENFFWRQFGVDDARRVKDLLGAAFEMAIDAPVVQMQREIEKAREQIDVMRGQIAELSERRIAAPKDGGMSAWLGLDEDQRTLSRAIDELKRRIKAQEDKIAAIKKRFAKAMAAAGAPLPPAQIDLLLDSVTGSDIVELAAAYEAVRGVSRQLRQLMDKSGEDLTYARRYYGMHTVLIALLVESQTRVLHRIDRSYLPKLKAIENDLKAAAAETDRLLKNKPTPEQRRVLLSNKKSQRIALDALRLYRKYLLRQREQIGLARARTVKELEVADNTLKTVDASFQLKEVMDSAAASFDALMKLESPGFERLFKNEELRREFQDLTDKIAPGS
ncbi:MAG: hypothetical protein MRY74_02960 [Neomegalonema sp.]|nr:hypothetical protein [Neomegalonema sp.]